MYVHNNLKHEHIVDQCEDKNHYLWIHLGKLSLDIGVVYKQPAANTQKFLETYASNLLKRKRIVVVGDLNLNLLSKGNSIKEYKTMLKENGLRILNKKDKMHCTRITKTSKTIIDHVCTTLKDNTFHMALVESAMSDHKQIYFEIKRLAPERPKKVQYEAINYSNLYKTIKDTTINNIHNEFTTLESYLLDAIARNKIRKTKILNQPRRDWINKQLITSINRRNILWHNLKQSQIENKKLEEEFLLQKNIVHKEIQTTKNQYYYKAFKDCKKNPLKMWQLINSLANNKTKQISTPEKLNTPSGITTDTNEISKCFNLFFANIGAELASKIPKSYHNNKALQVSVSKQNNNTKLEQFKPTSITEVLKIIENLDANTSTGIDGINTKVIKCVKDQIAENLTLCINKCLTEGQFPESLKIAKVSPIFKSGSKMDPGNYRPISVLPILSKVYEKIIHNRLSEFLASTNFLCEKQYGFRPKSNTLIATIDLVTKIKLNFDSKKLTLGVFIDLRKAFDTVSHEILLMKLNSLGVTGSAYEMLKSYLSNRYQIVKIGEFQSEPQLITFGVPQGSILGPLLFLIYINNIHEIGLKGDISLYADDTSLFYSGSSISPIIEQAQNDLDLLNTWLKSNLLTINIAKTNYIIFAAKNKNIDQHNKLNIDGEALNRVHEEKYLGLVLDDQLTWKPHIENIRNKLTSVSGALRGIVRCLPRQVRYNIYNSMVKSHMDYLIEVWGTAAKTNLKALQIAQNKIIKTLFRYNYLTPTEKIYKETKLMNLFQIYKYNTCILVRKILTKDIHSQIIFTKRIQTCNILTRRANDICTIKPRTNYGKKNIMYEGIIFYNKLPKDIKEIKSFNIYKKTLKNYILNDISLLSE